jgi:hypothetical protein
MIQDVATIDGIDSFIVKTSHLYLVITITFRIKGGKN